MFESYKTILQLVKTREQYDKLSGIINKRLLDNDVRRTINALDQYWNNYPGHDIVVPDVLLTEIGMNNADITEDQLRIYKGMIDVMMHEPDPDAAEGIIRTLRTMDFAAEMEAHIEAYHEGRDLDLYQTVLETSQKFERDISRSVKLDFIRDSIDEILEEEENGHRFSWPLTCLSGAMPATKTGMQFIFAARPGKGKTSFCAFAAVHFARQTPDNRPVMWLNNEGKGNRIKATTYRAALGVDRAGLITLGAKKAGTLYNEAIGGQDRIRIFDIHGRDHKFVERLIEKHRPAVVFFDMLDNIHGFGDAARTDLRLEFLYQWARESAVIYDFMSIPTSQISAVGEDTAWCDQSMLKDSKVGKQGACDAVIMMGAKNAPEFHRDRFMYIPKVAKMAPAPGYRPDCYTPVVFDGPTCQFVEPGLDENPEVNV